MPRLCKGVIGSLIIGLLLPLMLYAEEIIWYQMDFPPVYIQDGPNKNLGYQNIVDDLIKAALESQGHTVTYKSANMVRTLHDLKEGLHAGSGGLLKNPDLESYLTFSEPHTLSLAGMLMIRKTDVDMFKPFIDPSGAIVLDNLLKSNSKLIGICKNRPYSPAIDEILKIYATGENSYFRGGKDMGKGLVSMLLSKRIDCAILFPWEAYYIAEQMGREKEMMSIPIQGMTPYVLVYAVFPKNPWGKHMADIINPAIREFRTNKEFLKTKEKWLDEPSVTEYRRYVREYYDGMKETH